MGISKPQVILCDLDGTVANCDHRKRFIDSVIRAGDTVYAAGVPNSRSNPIKITKSDGASIPYLEDAHGNQYVANDSFDPSYGKRIKVRKKRDYKRFFESCKDDSPIQTTIDVVSLLSATYPVVFLSGRPEDCRQKTCNWLEKYIWAAGISPEGGLFMRPSGDTRQDYIVKEELYRKYIEPYYAVKLVLDDRDQVVSMWRDRLGLTCWQVNKGDF